MGLFVSDAVMDGLCSTCVMGESQLQYMKCTSYPGVSFLLVRHDIL